MIRRLTTTISWKNSSFFCVVLLCIYSILSFYRLGSTSVPGTFWKGNQDGTVIELDFGKIQRIRSISYYLGNEEKQEIIMEYRNHEDEPWSEIREFTMDRVYHWGQSAVRKNVRYLRLTCKEQTVSIGELMIQDQDGGILKPVNFSEYPSLFDEQDTFPERFTWQSGTVFDESLFGRTAYELFQGLPAFEDTHPPLGKILIGVGISVFGMNPFGWRVSGVIAGILLLVLVWQFARRVLKEEWLSAGVLALMTFDFMHFTESRLGQVDSFLVLFMTGMYYFMFCYYESITTFGSSLGQKKSGELIPGKNGWKYLFASGICMGCAISCKWSGCYGAAGLAVIWLAIMWSAVRKSMITREYVWKTTLVCVLFFVIIPIGIYLLSYIPFRSSDSSLGYWETMIENQKHILSFHTSQSAFHKQGSRWYQWPIMVQPIRLWAAWYPDQTGEFLVLMGNPAFWWIGILLFFGCAADCVKRRNGTMMFLLVGFLAPVIPWMWIARSSFIYHYYPSVPFLALLMGLWAKEHGKKGVQVFVFSIALSAVLFIMFFPLIAGLEVRQEYVEHFLQWLPTWKFTKQTI